MAELASAYPTSGGMYYWQYKLAGERWGPLACWLTGVLCGDKAGTPAFGARG
jgi:amino acid transporter